MGKRFLSMILSASLLLMLSLCGCSSGKSTAKGSNYLGRQSGILDFTDDPDDPNDPAKPTGGGRPGKLPDEKKVGISFPTKDLMRWDQDGDILRKELAAEGYTVVLNFADNRVDVQTSQIESQISEGCSVIVVAPVDGNALGTVLKEAKQKGVTVVAYDRLIMSTTDVDYYISFDNYLTGALQGEYIRDALSLDSAAGPFNLEIFAGDAGDNNAASFYNGAMDVLSPYIDSGKLVVVSGQKDFNDVATAAWKTDLAQTRMENLLASFYSDGTQLDAVLCSNDSTALGVTNALASNYTGKYPVITGQDCDKANVKNILAGRQSMSVFKDTRTMAEQTVRMVSDIMEGKAPEINDTATYNNGMKIVPAYLCTPVYVDENNYKTILIDSGFYTMADIT